LVENKGQYNKKLNRGKRISDLRHGGYNTFCAVMEKRGDSSFEKGRAEVVW